VNGYISRQLRLIPAAAFVLAVAVVPALHAAPIAYHAVLNGANEAPPNPSLGTGIAEVDVDAAAHTMHVIMNFTGLTTGNTACHIHAPTAVAGTGTAGVATTTPTFTGFPTGATSGSYDHLYDMTLATSYNPSYVTANGGTTATAEAALFSAIAAGKAYLNIHTTTVPGGEIRGFLLPFDPTPTAGTTWGRIKSLYR